MRCDDIGDIATGRSGKASGSNERGAPRDEEEVAPAVAARVKKVNEKHPVGSKDALAMQDQATSLHRSARGIEALVMAADKRVKLQSQSWFLKKNET